MHLRQLISLLAALWLGVAEAQTPTPATFNPLPADNASFFTALRTFLLLEDADRDANMFQSSRFQGCAHGTAAGMTGTFGATCLAFVDGIYTVEPAASINYTTQGATAADFCWVILHQDTTSAVSGFTRVAGTHYLTDCTSPSTSRPVLPTSDAMYVMGVTTSGSAITQVDQLYNHWPWIQTYTDITEIGNTRAGEFFLNLANVLCYTNGSTCVGVASADVSGCATCGDSATSFFSTGTIAPERGGTGDDTSALTAVPFINAGNWSYEAALHPSRGGTGFDSSAVTGIPLITAGAWSDGNFPTIHASRTPPALAVDGAQCVQDDNATLAVGVLANVIACADNSAGAIFGHFRLPGNYQSASAITILLAAQNTAAASGVSGFDVSCMCDSSGGTSSGGNFPSATNLDLTWSGTDDQVLVGSVTMTCGNACDDDDVLIVRLAVDATATTLAANIKYTLVSITATADEL